jgi:nucleoside-diphosphate kinase
VKTRRTFLKRTKNDTIKINDFFIGNTINIFSRSIKIVDFGDAFTARIVGKNQERFEIWRKKNRSFLSFMIISI